MKTLFSFILFLCICFVHSKPSGRIVGGQHARAGQLPWQVAIYVDTADGKYFCGGSLISAEWIVSAAHCLYNARLFTLNLGSTTLQGGDPNRVIVASSTFMMHPDFNPNTLEHDIGLIRLHLPIELGEYIQPIEVASEDFITEGTSAVISGWGQTSDTATGLANDLTYVTVAIISNAECQMTYGDQIKPTMVCAQGNYNEGICLGDTGGPLIVNEGMLDSVLVGVSGFYSQQGCESLHPSGFVRIDAYSAWIRNVTQTL